MCHKPYGRSYLRVTQTFVFFFLQLFGRCTHVFGRLDIKHCTQHRNYGQRENTWKDDIECKSIVLECDHANRIGSVLTFCFAVRMWRKMTEKETHFSQNGRKQQKLKMKKKRNVCQIVQDQQSSISVWQHFCFCFSWSPWPTTNLTRIFVSFLCQLLWTLSNTETGVSRWFNQMLFFLYDFTHFDIEW